MKLFKLYINNWRRILFIILIEDKYYLNLHSHILYIDITPTYNIFVIFIVNQYNHIDLYNLDQLKISFSFKYR